MPEALGFAGFFVWISCSSYILQVRAIKAVTLRRCASSWACASSAERRAQPQQHRTLPSIEADVVLVRVRGRVRVRVRVKGEW